MKNKWKMVGYIVVGIAILVIGVGTLVGIIILKQNRFAGHLWGAEWDYMMIDGQMYEREHSKPANLTRDNRGKDLGELYNDSGSTGCLQKWDILM